jgi:hypothetical protein
MEKPLPGQDESGHAQRQHGSTAHLLSASDHQDPACPTRPSPGPNAEDPGLREEVGVEDGAPRRAAQRETDDALLARVRSSSRIAGLLVRARARSMARRVRAACRRCRQPDIPLLIVVPFIEVECTRSKEGTHLSIPTKRKFIQAVAEALSPRRVRCTGVTPRRGPPGPRPEPLPDRLPRARPPRHDGRCRDRPSPVVSRPRTPPTQRRTAR